MPQKPDAKKDICKQVNPLPDRPGPRPLPTGGGGGGLPAELPDLPASRRAYGAVGRPARARGRRCAELMKAYDPALVGLLVPGMVIR